MTDLVVKRDEFFSTEHVPFSERLRLTRWINSTLPYVKIKRIEKVRNEHLYSAFQLKKKETRTSTITEMLHSTAAWNVPSIINNSNLNWRLVNRSTSFFKNADHADFHSSWSGGISRAFIVCDVLLKNSLTMNVMDNHDFCLRSFTDYYPHLKFGDVIAYYPKYVLYYDKPSHTKSSISRPYRFHSFYFDDDFSVNWAQFDAMFDKFHELRF